jgi:hypothetical protein
MLDGWHKSVGARGEAFVAHWCGLTFMYQEGSTKTCVTIEEVIQQIESIIEPIIESSEDDEALITFCSKPPSVAMEAEKLVNGDRGNAYGHPLDDFSKTAGMINACGILKKGYITAFDIPIIMNLVKLSRMTNNENNNHRDSIVDICGYMLTLEKCLDRAKEQ